MLALALTLTVFAGCTVPAENGADSDTAADSEALTEDSSRDEISETETDKNAGDENGGAENEGNNDNNDESGSGDVSKFPDGFSDWYPPASDS